MDGEPVKALNDLSKYQARYLLLLAMRQGAEMTGDIPGVIDTVESIYEVIRTWTKEEADDLTDRMNLVHKSIGCRQDCKDQGGIDGQVS